MESLLSGEDFGVFADALKEVSSLTDRLLQIKRNTGFTPGTFDGTDPTPNYVYFNINATAENITHKEATNSGGMLSLGDLMVTFPMDVLEKGEGGDGYTLQEGDVLIYDLKEWYMVGIPEREYALGGVAYTRSYWRRT